MDCLQNLTLYVECNSGDGGWKAAKQGLGENILKKGTVSAKKGKA